jgi:hypothetical protein
MKSLTIIIVAMFMLASCAPAPYIKGSSGKTGGDIHYLKDERTGLCFATAYMTAHSFTSVPCTPQVEALIRR